MLKKHNYIFKKEVIILVKSKTAKQIAAKIRSLSKQITKLKKAKNKAAKRKAPKKKAKKKSKKKRRR